MKYIYNTNSPQKPFEQRIIGPSFQVNMHENDFRSPKYVKKLYEYEKPKLKVKTPPYYITIPIYIIEEKKSMVEKNVKATYKEFKKAYYFRYPTGINKKAIAIAITAVLGFGFIIWVIDEVTESTSGSSYHGGGTTFFHSSTSGSDSSWGGSSGGSSS